MTHRFLKRNRVTCFKVVIRGPTHYSFTYITNYSSVTLTFLKKKKMASVFPKKFLNLCVVKCAVVLNNARQRGIPVFIAKTLCLKLE